MNNIIITIILLIIIISFINLIIIKDNFLPFYHDLDIQTLIEAEPKKTSSNQEEREKQREKLEKINKSIDNKRTIKYDPNLIKLCKTLSVNCQIYIIYK